VQGVNEPTQEALDLAETLGLSCVPGDIWCLRHKALLGVDGRCPIARADLTTLDAALAKAKAEALDEAVRLLIPEVQHIWSHHYEPIREVVDYVEVWLGQRAAEVRGGGERGE
jgi:hypothetical protein